jgi:hypothetical protein
VSIIAQVKQKVNSFWEISFRQIAQSFRVKIVEFVHFDEIPAGSLKSGRLKAKAPLSAVGLNKKEV